MSPLPLFEKPKRPPRPVREVRDYPGPQEKEKPKRASKPSGKRGRQAVAGQPTSSLERLSSLATLTLSGRVRRGDPAIRFLTRYAPYAVIVILVIIIGSNVFRAPPAPPLLSTIFTPEVQHWQPQILDWSARYGIDPNLMATVMQIESCGYPGAASSAGAQGLFQVMPSNFPPDVTDQLNPEANARVGMSVLKDCLRWADNDVGLALVCYNGGPSLISRAPANWPEESQRYFTWGLGIYNDATHQAAHSDTLATWLTAGGGGLCERASETLGLSTRAPTSPTSGGGYTNAPTFAAPPSALPTFSSGQPIIPPTVTPPIKIYLTPEG